MGLRIIAALSEYSSAAADLADYRYRHHIRCRAPRLRRSSAVHQVFRGILRWSALQKDPAACYKQIGYIFSALLAFNACTSKQNPICFSKKAIKTDRPPCLQKRRRSVFTYFRFQRYAGRRAGAVPCRLSAARRSGRRGCRCTGCAGERRSSHARRRGAS